jgi:hypothetical protein
MLITVRHSLGPDERLAPGALNGVIGRITSLSWSGGPTKARIVDASVIDDGRAAEITLDVDLGLRLTDFLALLADPTEEFGT